MADTVEHVIDVFRVTAEMIEDIAREQGIDLSDISPSELAQPPSSIAVGVAKGYLQALQAWLSEHEIAVGAALLREASAPRLVDNASEPTARECLEICTWCSIVIVTKLARAFECTPTGVDTMDDRVDANGSAKVALIAMDHSLGAWNILFRRIECRWRASVDAALQSPLSFYALESRARFPPLAALHGQGSMTRKLNSSFASSCGQRVHAPGPGRDLEVVARPRCRSPFPLGLRYDHAAASISTQR